MSNDIDEMIIEINERNEAMTVEDVIDERTPAVEDSYAKLIESWNNYEFKKLPPKAAVQAKAAVKVVGNGNPYLKREHILYFPFDSVFILCIK